MHLPAINYIDLIILLIFAFYISEAWRHGFWVIMAEFVSFAGSLVLSLRLYQFTSGLISKYFSLTPSIANALGFLITAIVIEIILGYIFGHLLSRLPEKINGHKLNKLLGVIPAFGEGVILIAFLITLIMALPVKPQVKSAIEKSSLGSVFLSKTAIVEKYLNEVFGGVIDDSLTYFTVHPGSKERVSLDVGELNLEVDKTSEKEMFDLVNSARDSLAVTKLIWSEKNAEIARSHAIDMWQRKYFGHVAPEGRDVTDRAKVAKIKYFIIGENLALAPTVKTAFTGLMNSQGHRENILEKRFSKVGIGVVDNGVYGKIFVQVFTD